MTILGISCHYHEAAAALVVDGKIVAAIANERLTRVKHDARFPKEAINSVLAVAKIKKSDIDYVVFYEKPFRKFERHMRLSIKYFPKTIGYFTDALKNSLTEKLWIKTIIVNFLQISPEKILFVPHHLSHAAASFYPSPYQEAAILTLDGVGEWTTGTMGKANGNTITLTDQMHFPHSIGLLYSAFTAFLGFEVNEGEYKVMGMAAYGKPRCVLKVKRLYRQHRDGSITLDLKYFSFHTSAKRMYSGDFVQLFLNEKKEDIAASIQAVTEEIVFNILHALYKKTNCPNLVYGGGVALNSALNGKIIRETPFRDVFIFPAAGDDGGAVGAALYVYHHVLGNTHRMLLSDIFLGGMYKITGNIGARMNEKKLLPYVVNQLVAGKVIGLFEGRSEFGPRALGHRSIIADPKNPSMKEIVNTKIKFREEFRPFAPVVLSEHASRYFTNISNNLSRYMLATAKATQRARRDAPAVVHIDGTSRVQVIDAGYSGMLRKLLEQFYKKTGRSVLLNTSFNVKGEPIVETPEDAMKTFANSGLDILVIGNYIVTK